MRTYYLHTISGRPAYFDGEGLAVVPLGGRSRYAIPQLRTTLEQIRREQNIDRKFWLNRNDSTPDYGYVRVTMPEDA